MSHVSLTYHIVFGTYERRMVIPYDHERELYKYIFDFSRRRGVFIHRIGGMPDHIHILCEIPPKTAVADYVQILKSETSKFLSVNPHFPSWERWAEGYAAFSVDASLREVRKQYIMNQRIHHAGISFADEYSSLLNDCRIPKE